MILPLTIITGPAPDDALVSAMMFTWAGWLGAVVLAALIGRWIMRRRRIAKEA